MKILTGSLIMLAIAVSMCIGWVVNIVKFTSLDFEDNYKAEIIRAIGIPIAPIGSILGLFVEFDEEKSYKITRGEK